MSTAYKVSIATFGILAIALVSVVGAGVLKNKGKNTVSQNNSLEQQNNATLPNEAGVSAPTSAFQPPVAFDHPSITDLFLSYNFYGTVSSLNQTPEGSQLILQELGANGPVFLITDKVLIQKTTQGKITGSGSRTDLKNKTMVTVSAYFDTKEAKWTTTGVYIPTDFQELQ